MDKKNQHIDPEFEDQSWANMSELLDREMPVKKRKRKLIGFWFLGFTALMVAGLFLGEGMIIFKKNRDNSVYSEKNRLERASIPIAIGTSTKPSNIRENNSKKIVGKHQQKTNNQEFQPKKNLNTTQTESKAKPIVEDLTIESTLPKINKQASTSIETIAPPLAIVSIKKKSNVSTAPESTIETNNAKEHSIIRDNKSLENLVKNANKEQLANFSYLTLPEFPVFHKEREIPLFSESNSSINKVSNWNFGLYASALTNNLGSYRAGFHSHLILNPKWRLHIGLGYALRNINQETNINADQESSFSIPEEMDVFDPNNTIIINPTINETEPAIAYKFTKFQYVELPVLFQYQFSPKWTVDLGGQIALTSRYQFQQIGNTTSMGSFNPTNLLDSADATFVDNLSLTAIGGISFQIAPKISAYSSYHFANYYLKNVAASIEEQRKWQKIEVGIRYYFK